MCNYLRLRGAKGSFIAETPAALWMLFFLFFFPLLDLATICLRTGCLYYAVHGATENASKARSFQATVGGRPSAKDLANSTITRIASSWTGMSLTNVDTQIIITNLSTSTQTKQNTPLSTPANDSENTYQVEVTATGAVNPLVTFNLPYFGNVPGLTEPVTITISDRQFFENPQGLSI